MDWLSISTWISTGRPSSRSARCCSHARMLPRSVRPGLVGLQVARVVKFDLARQVQPEGNDLAAIPPVVLKRSRASSPTRRPAACSTCLPSCCDQTSTATTRTGPASCSLRMSANLDPHLNEAPSFPVPLAADARDVGDRRCEERADLITTDAAGAVGGHRQAAQRGQRRDTTRSRRACRSHRG